ncbi:MAG TPA: hypothetical protein VFO58_18450 [Vicinamibacterales bacterium]|nr:hypothetical protein [Vicinamibacterales bacterium]
MGLDADRALPGGEPGRDQERLLTGVPAAVDCMNARRVSMRGL